MRPWPSRSAFALSVVLAACEVGAPGGAGVELDIDADGRVFDVLAVRIASVEPASLPEDFFWTREHLRSGAAVANPSGTGEHRVEVMLCDSGEAVVRSTEHLEIRPGVREVLTVDVWVDVSGEPCGAFEEPVSPERDQ